MSTALVPWNSIELLHNVVRTLKHLNVAPTVRYRAKVKLHGTNAAVQITPEGLFPQSRTQLLTVKSDFKGIAAWVECHAAYFKQREPMVIFGEWCGPGVEKGMAISQVTTKQFVVFAILHGVRGIIHEPTVIHELLGDLPPNMHILPWEGESFEINFADEAQLAVIVATLNDRVIEVEREDPWVRATFGISGVGEGLVLYPISGGLMHAGEALQAEAQIEQLMFKAKGEKHRTVGAKAAVQIDPTVVASVDAFVELVVTPARLEQGVQALGGTRDPKQTGAFIGWVTKDVAKECVAELEASGLTWDQVTKAVGAFARTWFTRRE
jgi:hypothetical protein